MTLWSTAAIAGLRSTVRFYRFLAPLTSTCSEDKRSLQISSPTGGHSSRFKNRRRRHGGSNSRMSGKALIDKYVKHLPHDGALVVRAPFLVEVKGSHFNEDNQVDADRNDVISKFYQKQHYDELDDNGSNAIFSNDQTTTIRQPETLSEAVKQTTLNLQRHLERERQRAKDDSESADSDGEEDSEERVNSPLHILLHGLSHHRASSFSVVNSQQQHHTYVYLTDTNDEETPPLEHSAIKEQYHNATVKDEAFVRTPKGVSATAHFSLWEPPSAEMKSPNGEIFSSSLRFFSFRNILENYDAYLKAVCLVPTYMNKIYIQGDLAGRINIDGTLIENLQSVGLTTEVGKIRIKDVTADTVSLSSAMGDIELDGIIDGNLIRVDTGGDGEVHAKGKSIFGGRLTINSQEGDVYLYPEIRSKECYVSTVTGTITAKDLMSTVTSLRISKEGRIFASSKSAAKIDISVAKGTVDLSLEQITTDSSIRVFSGDVTLVVPRKPKFKLRVSAPNTYIAPTLQNSGELSIDNDTGIEKFTTENSISNGKPVAVLSVEVTQGYITVAVPENDDNTRRQNYDAVNETLLD